jgi:AcrR family transcriptional regulator
VAEEVLLAKGYRETSIEEIASRVGLLKGSLYYYIENKEDLLYQVLTRGNARHLQVLREDRAISRGEPAGRLTHFVERQMELIHRDPRWNRLYEQDHVFLGADRLDSLNAIRQEVHSLLMGIVIDGMADGTFEPDTDPSVAAYSILSLIYFTTRWYRPTRRDSYRELSQWFNRFILKGLVGGEWRGTPQANGAVKVQ